MNNKIIYTIIGIVTTFLVLIVAYKLTNNESTSFVEITKIRQNDHVKWNKNAKKVLVEYSDFECPACKNFHDVLNTFEASNSADYKITQNVAFVFRHFPLYQIHPNANQAAYTAEAAGIQGKFYEMSDKLFNSQDQWAKLGNPKEYFGKLAKELNLDMNKFNSDIDSIIVKQKVDENLAEGGKAGINATPTFFFNGKRLDEVTSIDQFKKLLLIP